MRANRVVPNVSEIVRTRVLQGKTQADVALAGDIPRATGSRVERGYDATAPTAAGICKALGREFDDLFQIVCSGGAADQTREGVS